MLSTSTAFDTAATANIRKPVGRVSITWSDPYIDSGISISNNGENNISDDLHVANTVTETNYKWVLFDATNDLTGNYKLAPVSPQSVYEVGWYGDELCDSGGEFGVWDPQLTVTFPAKPIYGVVVAFEKTLGQWGVDFTIDIKLGASYEEVIFVSDNDSYYFERTLDTPVASADSIVLNIQKWNTPGTAAKVVEFYSSISTVYEGDVIKSISVTEEREIRDSTNPIGNMSSNEASVELQNIKINDVIDPFFPGNSASLLSSLLKPGRRVAIELGYELADGTTELKPMGTFWSGDFTVKDSSPTMSFTARDRMEKLRKVIYDDNALDYNKTVDNLLLDIVLSAQAKGIPINYDIDSLLNAITIPISFIERQDYFEAIKYVMTACGGQAYMSREDVLIFESSTRSSDYSGSPDLFITKSEYFSKDQPTHYEDLINLLEIETQPLTLGSNETLYSTNDSISLGASAILDPIEIKYSSFPASSIVINYTGTGCSPYTYNVEYLSWGMILTVANSAGTAGTFTFTVTGNPYEVIGENVISSKDDSSIAANGEKSYRLPVNKLIQRDDIAQDIADDLIDYYADPRNDLMLTWRGNPALELGDIIVVPEYQRGAIDNKARFKIYKMQTEFDGTLKQTISARRIDTYTP